MAANVSLLCAAPLAPLRVSDNHRFLVTTEGKPFFWLADTAWQLIHDLDEAEMRRYFADPAGQGLHGHSDRGAGGAAF